VEVFRGGGSRSRRGPTTRFSAAATDAGPLRKDTSSARPRVRAGVAVRAGDARAREASPRRLGQLVAADLHGPRNRTRRKQVARGERAEPERRAYYARDARRHKRLETVQADARDDFRVGPERAEEPVQHDTRRRPEAEGRPGRREREHVVRELGRRRRLAELLALVVFAPLYEFVARRGDVGNAQALADLLPEEVERLVPAPRTSASSPTRSRRRASGDKAAAASDEVRGVRRVGERPGVRRSPRRPTRRRGAAGGAGAAGASRTNVRADPMYSKGSSRRHS